MICKVGSHFKHDLYMCLTTERNVTFGLMLILSIDLSAWMSVSLASVCLCVASESSQLMLKVITIKQSFSRLTEKMFP
jgi:hypothetical protein